MSVTLVRDNPVVRAARVYFRDPGIVDIVERRDGSVQAVIRDPGEMIETETLEIPWKESVDRLSRYSIVTGVDMIR